MEKNRKKLLLDEIRKSPVTGMMGYNN